MRSALQPGPIEYRGRRIRLWGKNIVKRIQAATTPVFLFLALPALLVACGGGGGGSNVAAPASEGAPSVAVRTAALGSNDPDCPTGGVLVESGIDDNQNSVLDAVEVDATEKVCHGATGLNSLIKLAQEARGANCPRGGVRIDAGLDIDQDDALDSGEITSSEYLCNATGDALGWGIADLLEINDAENATDPQVAMDGDGNAIAVWRQSDGTRLNIYAARYTAGVGWGTRTLIESNNGGDAEAPQISLNLQGDGVAVWHQNDGFQTSIWANRYAAGTGWGTAMLIESDNPGNAWYPQVAVDNSGNAIAVWHQTDGSRYSIWTARYTAGTGWATPTLIESEDAGDAMFPQLAIDSNGNAIAVWHQHDGTRYNIRANRYTISAGWDTAVTIEAGDAGDAIAPRVALDGSGNAVAVWYQSDGTRTNIWTNRYTTSGWDSPALIEAETADAFDPKIAVDAGGNAIAIWQQYVGALSTVLASRYIAGVGWGAATAVVGANTAGAYNPQIAMDANGNAVAVWHQSDGTRNNVWANRYGDGSGWGSAVLIETDNAGDALYPEVAVDTNGNAFAIWQQSDGTRENIWVNRFVAQ